MNIFKTTPNFNFLAKKRIFGTLSTILVLASLVIVIFKGFNYGVDFRGGTLIQVQFTESVTLEELRPLLGEVFSQDLQISRFGEEVNNEILIRFNDIPNAGESYDVELNNALKEKFPGFSIRRVETIGPKVGSELKEKALYSILTALAGILIYTAFRFKFIYGLGAILALFHDVMIILGIFSLFSLQMDLTIVAAILTIVGYSLNDTIVVYDRVRENSVKQTKSNFSEIINKSINETLNRTIMTSLCTLVVVLSLYIWGGDIIHDFSLSISIGIVVGTYSSVFIACPSVILIRDIYQKRQEAKK